MKAAKLQNKMKNRVLEMVDQKAANEREEYYEQASYKNFIQQKNSMSNQNQIIYEEEDGMESNKYSE